MNKLFKKIISSIMVLSLLMYILPIYALASDESVYTKAKANGERYKTIVTTKNDKETKQEDSNKELPLETKITYTLNGNEIAPEELAGKSGKVSIKIEYTNKSEKQVYVNGRYETMYTPFVVAVGTLIDTKNNKNIEVKNAKIIENGDKSIIVGLVMPGMKESLKLSGEFANINIPNSIEITMDATKFEMKNIISFATPKLFDEKLDLSKLDNLLGSVNELKTNIDKIEEGANTLKDGVIVLDEGSKTLNSGANQLNDGASKLSDGANQVNQGADALNNGISDLKDGLAIAGTGIVTLKNGTTDLANGANEVNTGAQNLSNGLNSLNNQAGVLQTNMGELATGVEQLNTGAQTIKTKVNGLASKLPNYVSEEKVSQLEGLIQSNTAVLATLPEGSDLYNLIAGNIQALTQEKTLLEKASQADELIAGINNLADGIENLNAKTQNLPTTVAPLIGGINQLATGANQLAAGTEQLNNGAVALDGGATQLAQGASQLNSGVEQLQGGAEQLYTGTTSLANGANELSNGLNTLADGTVSLSDGTNQLKDGTNQLAEGIHEYNEQGITKITNFINGDLSNLINRFKKLEDLSIEYNKFNSDEVREKIKFITIVDSVKTSQKDEDKQDIIDNTVLNNKEDKE
ncbi:MAG: hypothetical protein IKF97_04455 [Clostridia bacterium]|nr:hypothetical protein [Clostridia bacterium]